ncbi:MAG: glycosyltransferase family 2 protein [Bacteroidales bacterium]|nr:glycosyltransferase family 2 protein [Bacteroidales bacterium]
MDFGLVSIIMPSFNCGKYVEETIRCIQSQTYSNWEIIFIDDCSTDDTIRKVTEMRDKDARIHLFKNSHNLGAAISRNNALQEAKGRWIAFLDSDDLWEPTKLEKQVRFMEENGYKFSYTEYQEMDADGNLTGVTISGPKHVTKRGMYNFCWPGCLTVIYDAQAVGLIQIEDIKKNNDYAMWLKVCKKADCHLLPEVLAKYRRGRAGSVSTHGVMTMIGWHYKLWHEAEKRNAVASLWLTGMNLIFGFYKKLKYVKKV